jgi:hypothetical protein
LEYGLIKQKPFPSKNEVQKCIKKDTKKYKGINNHHERL